MAKQPESDPDRFKTLPEHVAIEDTVEEHPAAEPPDPNGGLDPEQQFFLRNVL